MRLIITKLSLELVTVKSLTDRKFCDNHYVVIISIYLSEMIV